MLRDIHRTISDLRDFLYSNHRIDRTITIRDLEMTLKSLNMDWSMYEIKDQIKIKVDAITEAHQMIIVLEHRTVHAPYTYLLFDYTHHGLEGAKEILASSYANYENLI